MLAKWDFTPLVVEPIRKQYDPLDAEEPHDRMASLLFGGRMLTCAFLGTGRVEEAQGEEEILSTLRMTRQEVLGLRDKMEEELVRVHQITRG